MSRQPPSLRRVDESLPQVDGLRLIERVDSCGRGEVWRARIAGGLAGEQALPLPGDLTGVGECSVRLLRLPVDEALRARAQTLARDLMALDEPGLLPIRDVRKAFDGVALVYGHPPAEPTGLHLIARRRLLSAGEVVTLGVALAWALAHAHAAGIVHGRLADADVLIGSDGRPVLSGVGILGVLGAPNSAAADVRALERMLGSLLDRETAGAARISRALADGSSTAAELATVLAASAPAVPIGVDGPAADAVPVRGRRPSARARVGRPGWLRPRVLLAAAGVVLLGALAGWASAPGPHARAAAAPGSAPPAVPATDWSQVLARLDTAWAAAFEQPETGFGAVDAPTGPAYRADTEAAASLRARGLHAAGLRLVLMSVGVESASPQRVILRVTDRRSSYELRDRSGAVVTRVAARGSAAHRIELVATSGAGTWRFAEVTGMPAAAPAVSS